MNEEGGGESEYDNLASSKRDQRNFSSLGLAQLHLLFFLLPLSPTLPTLPTHPFYPNTNLSMSDKEDP